MNDVDRRTIDEHNELLIRLKQWAFGNGVKGASRRLEDVEKNIQSINVKLSIVIVFTGIIIIATIPDLLKLFKVV